MISGPVRRLPRRRRIAGQNGSSLRSCAAVCAFIACISGSCRPQTFGSQQQSASQPTSPAYTLHTRTNLVIEDIVVTDGNHNPVHNLKANDFTVIEDGRPQHIRSFEEHTAGSNTLSRQVAMPKVAPGIFTNFSPAPQNGPVNILLLDTLNTPLQDQFFVRSQLLDYLKKASPGTQIAIFGLSNRLSILQGFTSNLEILKTALTSKRTKASSLLDDPVGGGGGGVNANSVSDALRALGGVNDPNMEQMIANVQQFEAQTGSFQLQLRARYTLDALNELARYLVGIPGRKNLIWFSGSFPVNVMPNGGDAQDPFAAAGNAEAEFRETTDLLARSQVAVYPIDARGLATSPVYSTANSGAKYARSPQAAGKDELKFAQQSAQENQTMQQMAADTGGQAFVNTNGLSEAVAKAVEAGSNYYTFTYSPTNLDWDGKFRKVEIEVRDKRFALSYRRGYYGDDPESPPKATEVTPMAVPQQGTTTVERVMMRGAPTPTQILFTTRVLPTSGTTEAKVADGNSLTPEGAKLKGAFRRYAIDFAVDQRSLTFTQSPDGLHHGFVEILTAVYDQNGTLINRTGNNVHADLSAANFARFLQTPLSFNQEISVPENGEYFLRIAVHDLQTDRAGAVEVPVNAVKNLLPLATPASGGMASSQPR
jgi:VWFA-related protein